MAVINLHINFNGNAEVAFEFYQSVFGGAFTKIIRFKDISSPENPIAEKEANKAKSDMSVEDLLKVWMINKNYFI